MSLATSPLSSFDDAREASANDRDGEGGTLKYEENKKERLDVGALSLPPSRPSVDGEAVETRTEWPQPPTRHESLSPFRGFNAGTNFASPFLRRSALSGRGASSSTLPPPSSFLRRPRLCGPHPCQPQSSHIFFSPWPRYKFARELAVGPIGKKKTVTPTDGNRV